MAPDERAFEEDLLTVAYLVGEAEGRWGRVIRTGVTWPAVIFWVGAAPRAARADRYHFRILCDGYPSQGPTAAIWNAESDTFLEHNRFPRGRGQVQAVLRSDWNGGQALYHPMDRVAVQGHGDWGSRYLCSLWHPKRTIVDFLELVHELLSCNAYTGVN